MSHAFDMSRESQRKINFKKKWLAAHQTVVSKGSIEKTIQNIKSLEKKFLNANQMVVVYKLQDLQIKYVSKNVEEILGYTQEEFLGWKESAFLKIGGYNQPTYLSNILKWDRIINEKTPHQKGNGKGLHQVCGVRYLCKDGSTRQFLMRQDYRAGKNYILPEFNLIFFEDVSHLLKGEDYWLLVETDNEIDKFTKFFTKEGEENYPITARQKEVLTLIAEGKSSKEVAAELSISRDTVSQHRKNMNRKMMARDTSSLIQICKICGII